MGRKSIAKERRTQILEAFYRCTVENGQVAASIRNIAKEAGIQPSMLHHYFQSRDEIIEEAVVYFTDLIFTDFHGQMQTLSGDAERLARGMEFIFSKGMINTEYTGFFLECLVAGRTNDKVKQTLAQLFERFRQAIMDHLHKMEGFSELAEPDRRMLAALIVAMHEGIELQWFADPEQIDLNQVLTTTNDLIQAYIKMRAPK